MIWDIFTYETYDPVLGLRRHDSAQDLLVMLARRADARIITRELRPTRVTWDRIPALRRLIIEEAFVGYVLPSGETFRIKKIFRSEDEIADAIEADIKRQMSPDAPQEIQQKQKVWGLDYLLANPQTKLSKPKKTRPRRR